MGSFFAPPHGGGGSRIEIFNLAQNAEGEESNAHFPLVFCPLDDFCEQFRFNVAIVNGGVAFAKSGVATQKAVCGFGRGLEILTACGLPVVVNAHLLVFIAVQDMLARQTPKVEQRISLTTETEYAFFKGLLTLNLATIGKPLARFGLSVQPVVEISGI